MAPTTTGLMATLVGFGTTSRNPDLAGWVRAGLDGHGLPCRASLDATEGTANLRGGGGGGVAAAHQPGERIPEAGLAACGAAIRCLRARMAA